MLQEPPVVPYERGALKDQSARAMLDQACEEIEARQYQAWLGLLVNPEDVVSRALYEQAAEQLKRLRAEQERWSVAEAR